MSADEVGHDMDSMRVYNRSAGLGGRTCALTPRCNGNTVYNRQSITRSSSHGVEEPASGRDESAVRVENVQN